MSSGGDGVYCRMFIVRERREALSSHLALAWKGTRNLSAPSQGRRGVGGLGPDTPGTRGARAIPPHSPAPSRPGEGSFWVRLPPDPF